MRTIVDNLFHPEPFFIEFEQTYLHGDYLSKKDINDEPPLILLLHGGSPAEDKGDFSLLQQLLLYQYGLSSCSFDFIGHGSTGGELGYSSLQQRTQQASEIIHAYFDSQPLSIVAVGQGAYTALKLSQ